MSQCQIKKEKIIFSRNSDSVTPRNNFQTNNDKAILKEANQKIKDEVLFLIENVLDQTIVSTNIPSPLTQTKNLCEGYPFI